MNFIHFSILSIISITCFAGPLEDIANTPELTLVSPFKQNSCFILKSKSSFINN